ncbi:hypothetical protein NC796_19735 [Aliifodinibius sp. S!AR15-10]|uniref:hypothetical protein n=1 Tax=Aliifodinibius sp. S!AR15-10 TaxID=2950437 RepID=UPI00285BDF23|nr:hypothetical protein [Aliifodinibius sp. S!AR15-10]MDR8393396.1 hypothetical protein [Aliifodinibius sp. S!AR15-10]
MERIVHIAKNQDEARKWDIHQALEMTHEQRQEVAAVLKKRVYGEKTIDIRAYHKHEGEE